MNLEKSIIKMTIRKIVKSQMTSPILYELYFSVQSYHPKNNKVKQSNIIEPLICVTEYHFIPTDEGYKPIEDIKIGDVVLMGLDLMCRPNWRIQ